MRVVVRKPQNYLLIVISKVISHSYLFLELSRFNVDCSSAESNYAVNELIGDEDAEAVSEDDVPARQPRPQQPQGQGGRAPQGQGQRRQRPEGQGEEAPQGQGARAPQGQGRRQQQRPQRPRQQQQQPEQPEREEDPAGYDGSAAQAGRRPQEQAPR